LAVIASVLSALSIVDLTLANHVELAAHSLDNLLNRLDLLLSGFPLLHDAADEASIWQFLERDLAVGKSFQGVLLSFNWTLLLETA
jgi:hypothetical protein